jgi:hypothetical protein
MATMLGARTTTKLPWSQCNCGCLAGSRSRKAERQIQRSREKAAVRKEINQEMKEI